MIRSSRAASLRPLGASSCLFFKATSLWGPRQSWLASLKARWCSATLQHLRHGFPFFTARGVRACTYPHTTPLSAASSSASTGIQYSRVARIQITALSRFILDPFPEWLRPVQLAFAATHYQAPVLFQRTANFRAGPVPLIDARRVTLNLYILSDRWRSTPQNIAAKLSREMPRTIKENVFSSKPGGGWPEVSLRYRVLNNTQSHTHNVRLGAGVRASEIAMRIWIATILIAIIRWF